MSYNLKKRNSGNDSGLTMIEIIMVLFIIGVVSVVVIGRSLQEPVRLTARAENIKAHLRYAQARALNTNSTWGVRCNPAGDRYWLFQFTGGVEQQQRLPGEEVDIIDLAAENIVLTGMAVVSFNSWGRPCLDAAGTVAGGSVFSLSSEGRSLSVTITNETGFIP